MKLYFHPMSTTSRPVMLFCAESKIDYEPVLVDILKGEHYQEAFLKLNPKARVPVLDDNGFVLTESSAILQYLADKINSPAYPKEPRERGRVHERMHWCSTDLYVDLGYHLTYPQLFDHHKRAPETANQVTTEWGKAKTEANLRILDQGILGDAPYLCGERITLADYYGACLVTLAEYIGLNFSKYPKVASWLAKMKALPTWKKVNEAHDSFAASLKGKRFVTIG